MRVRLAQFLGKSKTLGHLRRTILENNSAFVTGQEGLLLERARLAYVDHRYSDSLAILLESLALQADYLDIDNDGRVKVKNESKLHDLGETLHRIHKAVSWLNISNLFDIPVPAILSDLKSIYSFLGDKERLAEMQATFAFEHIANGEPHAALASIRRGLKLMPKASGLRAILDAHANLSYSLGFSQDALKLFRQVSTLDVWLPISPESAALIEASIKSSELLSRTVPDNPKIYYAMEKIADVCKEAKHAAFEVEILGRLSDIALLNGHFELALKEAQRADEVLRQFPGTFPNLEEKVAALSITTAIQSDIYETKELETSINEKILRIRWDSLRQTFLQGVECIKKGWWHPLATAVAMASELITRAILDSNGLEIKGTNTTLLKKVEILSQAGLFNQNDQMRLRKLIELRNRQFHGNDLSVRLLEMRRTPALTRELVWLVRLVETFNLYPYRPGSPLIIESFRSELRRL